MVVRTSNSRTWETGAEGLQDQAGLSSEFKASLNLQNEILSQNIHTYLKSESPINPIVILSLQVFTSGESQGIAS